MGPGIRIGFWCWRRRHADNAFADFVILILILIVILILIGIGIGIDRLTFVYDYELTACSKVDFMSSEQEVCFSHEKLDVYREAIGFIAWLSQLLEAASRLGDIKDQLDRAANSVALNIAEGNGKYSAKDRCRFFDTAHGSALECAAGLDILVAKAKSTADQIRPGKENLQRIVKMLMGLIKRYSARAYERGDPAN